MSTQQPPLRNDPFTLSQSSPPPPSYPAGRLQTQALSSAAEQTDENKTISSADLLRPHSIGGVFDLAFDIYRTHFRAFVLLLAVLLLPTQAILTLLVNTWLKPLENYLDAHAEDAGAALTLVSGYLFTGIPQAGFPGLLSLLVLGIVSAPIAIAVGDVYRGRAPVWSNCYGRAFARIPRVLLGWILAGFAFAAIVALTSAFLFFVAVLWAYFIRSPLPEALTVILTVLALFSPYVAAMTLGAFCFSFTAPLIVLEDTPVTQIPARCRQLTARPRALRIWTAIVFLPIVFLTAQTLMLLSLSSFLSLFTLLPLLRFCIESTLNVLLIVFLQPYLLIFLNVLYFDCRIGREALDIHLLAERQEAGR